MLRLIFGIVIATFGVIGLIVSAFHLGVEGLPLAILFAACGAILIYFGARYLNRKKNVTLFALQMLRADAKIDAGELADQLRINEIEVRKHIVRAQRKGIIPFKADIV